MKIILAAAEARRAAARTDASNRRRSE